MQKEARLPTQKEQNEQIFQIKVYSPASNPTLAVFFYHIINFKQELTVKMLLLIANVESHLI
jgi:hypothetical protein